MLARMDEPVYACFVVSDTTCVSKLHASTRAHECSRTSASHTLAKVGCIHIHLSRRALLQCGASRFDRIRYHTEERSIR
jgi:hypothetical protein